MTIVHFIVAVAGIVFLVSFVASMVRTHDVMASFHAAVGVFKDGWSMLRESVGTVPAIQTQKPAPDVTVTPETPVATSSGQPATTPTDNGGLPMSTDSMEHNVSDASIQSIGMRTSLTLGHG